jgi:hypothetical protein
MPDPVSSTKRSGSFCPLTRTCRTGRLSVASKENGTILTTRHVKRTLSAEITEKVDQADNASAPIEVSLWRDHQKSLVGVGSFFVLLAASCRLAQVENVSQALPDPCSRLCAVRAVQAANDSHKIDHRQSGDSQRFVLVRAQAPCETLQLTNETHRRRESPRPAKHEREPKVGSSMITRAALS